MSKILTTNDIGNLVSDMVERLVNAAPGYTSHVLLPDGSILKGSRGNCQFEISRGFSSYVSWLPARKLAGIDSRELAERVGVFELDGRRHWMFWSNPWHNNTKRITQKLAVKFEPRIKWASHHLLDEVIEANSKILEETIP